MRKNKFYSILAWIILVIIILGIIGLIGTSGVILLKMVGIQYQSLKDLIIFIIMLFIISIPIDLLIEILPKVLHKADKIKKENIPFILYPLNYIGNILTIGVIDLLMESVKKHACFR